MESTTVAAKKIVEDSDITRTTVTSETVGRLYGLTTLYPSINHNKDNTTRFIILAKEHIYRQGAGKLNICFELPHKSGSLYNMLGNSIHGGINMVMIESRPTQGRNRECRFFVDIEGNLSDAFVQNAPKSIPEEASNMWILGNY